MAMLNASEDLEIRASFPFNKEKEGTHHFHITTQNMPGPRQTSPANRTSIQMFSN